jgi:hypothetical protein
MPRHDAQVGDLIYGGGQDCTGQFVSRADRPQFEKGDLVNSGSRVHASAPSPAPEPTTDLGEIARRLQQITQKLKAMKR